MKNPQITLILLLFLASHGHSKQLPLTDFIKDSEFTYVSISPDGKKLASVINFEGMDKVAIMDLKNMQPLSAKTFGKNRRIDNLTWASDDMIIMSVEKRVGNLDRKGKWDGVYAMRFDGKNDAPIFAPTTATSKGNTFGVTVVDGLPDDPRKILIEEFKLGGVHVYEYDLKSKQRKILSEPADKYSGAPYLSVNKKPVVATAFDFENSVQYLHYKTEDATVWKKLDIVTDKQNISMMFAGNSKNPDIVYILSNHDAPTMGLFKLNLTTGDLTKLYRNPTVDIQSAITNQNDETIGFYLTPDFPEVIWVDADDPIAKVYQGLKQSFPNQAIRIFNFTRDHKKMVFRVFSDKNPGEFYLLDLSNNKIKPLASTRHWIKPADMSPMQPITISARDGVELHGYLTLPKDKNPKNLPLVVNPHGGPHGPRDNWRFNPEVQLLANRGYAVLQINFRGSGGYGVDFELLGYKKWGREMQDDITDATLWVVEQGYADKNRICLYGGSYGGYATLQGLVREPDLYQCGIGYVGVYDLKKFRTCGDVASGGYVGKTYLDRVIGNDNAELEANSPAYNTDKIKAKVFLAHGEDDVRVPMCQLNSLLDGLKKSNVDYEVMTRDEGHGYQDPQNVKDFYTRLLSFLDENIGH